MPRVGSAPQEQNRPACADRGATARPFQNDLIPMVARAVAPAECRNLGRNDQALAWARGAEGGGNCAHRQD